MVRASVAPRRSNAGPDEDPPHPARPPLKFAFLAKVSRLKEHLPLFEALVEPAVRLAPLSLARAGQLPALEARARVRLRGADPVGALAAALVRQCARKVDREAGQLQADARLLMLTLAEALSFDSAVAALLASSSAPGSGAPSMRCVPSAIALITATPEIMQRWLLFESAARRAQVEALLAAPDALRVHCLAGDDAAAGPAELTGIPYSDLAWGTVAAQGVLAALEEVSLRAGSLPRERLRDRRAFAKQVQEESILAPFLQGLTDVASLWLSRRELLKTHRRDEVSSIPLLPLAEQLRTYWSSQIQGQSASR